MENHKLKELFLQADKEIPIRRDRRQQAYECMTSELEGQRIPTIKRHNIFLNQFLYMDKTCLFIYIALICAGTAFMLLLRHTGAERNDIIIFSMIAATVLGIFTVLLIDKMFFEKMAELGASCYFNTKQCVAIYMLIAGSVNLVILFLVMFYVGWYWKMQILQIGLYILTPFLISNIAALGILSTEAGRNNLCFLPVNGVFLSIGYIVLSGIPEVFYVTSLGIWGIACVIMGISLTMQIRRLLSQIEKGEVLCMN